MKSHEPTQGEMDAFREAWEAADARGDVGNRVRAGLIAAYAERKKESERRTEEALRQIGLYE